MGTYINSKKEGFKRFSTSKIGNTDTKAYRENNPYPSLWDAKFKKTHEANEGLVNKGDS